MGLFGRLLKLHSGAVPREDFFTEVVAHLFEAEPETCLAWIDQAGLLSQKERLGVRISTQHSLDALEHHATGSRPDMLIQAYDEEGIDAVLVESKIGSREGLDQLRRYAELLVGLPDAREKTLVYITRDYDPKGEEEILEGLDGRIRFAQLRWHDFYHFLRTQPETTLTVETLSFMEEHTMAQSSKFTPVDVLAISNLPKALAMMDETMQGEVSEKLQSVIGDSSKVRANTLLALKEHNRYMVYATLQGWSFWCGLIYHLQPEHIADYPWISLHLEVSSNAPARNEIVEAMQEIEKREEWYGYNLSIPKVWAGVKRERSLQDFLSSEDHVTEIKRFFLESLEELREIKEQYPHLPWGSSSI